MSNVSISSWKENRNATVHYFNQQQNLPIDTSLNQQMIQMIQQLNGTSNDATLPISGLAGLVNGSSGPAAQSSSFSSMATHNHLGVSSLPVNLNIEKNQCDEHSRILIVDDNAFNTYALSSMLLSMDIQSDEAHGY